jgi:hypothetical protein
MQHKLDILKKKQHLKLVFDETTKKKKEVKKDHTLYASRGNNSYGQDCA